MADEQRTLAVNLTANASGFANGTNEAIRKLKELNTQVAENKQHIKQTSTEMKEYQRKLNELKAATDGGKKATAEEKQEMQRLKDAIAQCAANIGTYQTAQQRLQSEIRNTNRQLDEQRASAEQVNGAFTTMGEVLKANLLSGAITNAVSQLTGALQTCATYAYSVGSQFEAGMSQVEAISGASGETLQALTDKAKELGASTRFSATEAAQAMNYMAMAGWDAEQMLSGIDGVMSLAAASGADLGETADIVTDAITAFGLKAEDVGHFSDVLAAASANANTNVSMMGESFKYVAPLAGTMGYTIDETAEALGIMANSGIKASTAGTSLRTILTNLTSGVTISSEAFGEMEITAANADGTMKSLNTVLGELREAFAQMSDAEKTTNGNLIAGDRALSGFLSLVNAGEGDINKLRSAIESADGSAGNMAQTMTKNVAGSVTIMKSAIESLGIAAFEKFGDKISAVVERTTEAVTDLTQRIDGGELDVTFERLAESIGVVADDVLDFVQNGLPDFVEGLAKTITTIANLKTEIAAGAAAFIAYKSAVAALTIFSKVAGAIEQAGTAQKALNAAMAANPIGLVATAVAGLVFGISELVGHLDDCNERMKEFNIEAENAVESSQEYIDKADGLQVIADKYRDIADGEGTAAQKKIKLNELMDEFVDKYGSEVGGIKSITDAYAEQGEVLDYLNQLRETYNSKAEDDAIMAAREAMEAEKQKTFLNFSSGTAQWTAVKYFNDNGINGGRHWYDAPDKTGTHKWEYANWDNLYLMGTYEERLQMLEGLRHEFQLAGLSADYNMVSGMISDIQDAIKTRDSASSNYFSIANDLAGIKTTDYNFDPTSYYKQKDLESQARGQAEMGALREQEEAANLSAEERKRQYDKEKQLADDMYSVEEITAAEYYNRLTELRDTYFEEGSHEWYQATAQIRKLGEQIGTVLGDAAADDAEKVKTALNEIKQAYSDTLAEIDKEFARRSQERTRQQEDEDYYQKREQITTRLAYDNLDTYSRRSLEKELAELDKDREDVMWERSGEDRRQGAQTAYETGTELLNGNPLGGLSYADWTRGISLATEIVASAAAKGQVTNSNINRYVNIVIQGIDKTDEQIAEMVKNAIASDAV